MRKFLLHLLPIVVLALLFTTCKKSPKCWGKDESKGEILGTVDWPECFELFDLEEGQSVLRSHEDVMALQDCDGASFDFDFSEYSILAFEVQGGCELKILKEVSIDHSAKKYLYTIKMMECGLCEKLEIHYEWVKVPAIPDDYEVKFELVKK